MLAGSRDGLTEALLIAQGFTVDQLVELIRAGLATTPERIRMGSREIEVARVRITDEGRQAVVQGKANRAKLLLDGE